MDILPLLLPLAYFAIIIGLTWVVARFASTIAGRIMRTSMPQVAAKVQRFVWLLIWLTGAIIAVEEAGIRSDILLLIVGLFGVGAIAAVRLPLENIGARYFSDMYIPFKVGDAIKVGEYSGKVIEVNSMGTILLADDDTLVSIPNSILVERVVVNKSPQAWKEVAIPITIGSDVDPASFESSVLKSLNKLSLHLDKRFPPVLTTKSTTPQSTELLLTVMIRRPEERDAIVTEVNKRITEVLERMSRAKKKT
jgi:small conductance mechanosensitive channel